MITFDKVGPFAQIKKNKSISAFIVLTIFLALFVILLNYASAQTLDSEYRKSHSNTTANTWFFDASVTKNINDLHFLHTCCDGPEGLGQSCYQHVQINNYITGQPPCNWSINTTYEFNDPDFICKPVYDRDIILETGSIEIKWCSPCVSSCVGNYNQLCMEPPDELSFTYQGSADSTYTVSLDCEEGKKISYLQITTRINDAHITRVGSQPSGSDFLINGQVPAEVLGYTHSSSTGCQQQETVYGWYGSLRWNIPLSGKKCRDKVTITPSLTNSGYGYIGPVYVSIVYQSCDLEIINFSGNRTVIDPSIGENVNFTGNVTETSGETVTWTVTLTDSSGATKRTFNGSGKSVSVTWDGKNSFGTIVDDGLYTATLEVRTGDGQCSKMASTQVTVKSSCNVSSISISPDTVRPAQTGDDSLTKATIGIALIKPAPSSGCVVKLSVEPVEGTGGHSHDGNRKAHTGTVDQDSVVFVPGESILDNAAVYTSGVVAGTEKIIAEVLDSKGSVSSTQSVSVDVKVKDLEPLPEDYTYNLTGSTGQTTASACLGHAIEHPDNHYGQPYTIGYITWIALDYYVETNQKLGINDMSLVWGGLFDICGNWAKPHTLLYGHPVGLGVDIDPNAQDEKSGRSISVNQTRLDEIAASHDGTRAPEPQIHYTFPSHE